MTHCLVDKIRQDTTFSTSEDFKNTLIITVAKYLGDPKKATAN